MNNSRTKAADQEDTNQSLEYIQQKVADVNEESAQAVSQSLGLITKAYPDATLVNTHSALLNTAQELQRALSQIEREIDDLESGYGQPTPNQIRSDHADRITETYDGPVRFVALQLLERNVREWLQEKPDTVGAEQVERHGLAENQREQLNELQDAWRAYDGASE